MATKATRQLYWYLAERSAKGRITVTKMHRVPNGENDVKGIVYVQAYDTDEAIEAARKEYDRVKSKLRKDMLRTQGKCTCGGERDNPEFKTCNLCRERMKEYRQNKKDKKEGKLAVDGRGSEQKKARGRGTRRNRQDEMKFRVFVDLRTRMEKESMTLAQVKRYIANEILRLRKVNYVDESTEETG